MFRRQIERMSKAAQFTAVVDDCLANLKAPTVCHVSISYGSHLPHSWAVICYSLFNLHFIAQLSFHLLHRTFLVIVWCLRRFIRCCVERKTNEQVCNEQSQLNFFLFNQSSRFPPASLCSVCMYITYIASHLFFVHSNLNVLHWWLLNWSRQTRQQDRKAKYEWNARNQRQTSQHLHISNLSFQMEKQQQLSSLKAHDFMICTQLYQTTRRGLPERAQKNNNKV